MTPAALHGTGMTSQRTRERMIERLREQGIADPRVLHAMGAVPRHLFVDVALAHRAYDDAPLPLGFGQTISQPFVVARMIELLMAGRELGKTLEIGAGCGYQAAVLGTLAAAADAPPALLSQLAPGGRLALPVGNAAAGVQMLTVYERTPTGFTESRYDAVRFVPLLPGVA